MADVQATLETLAPVRRSLMEHGIATNYNTLDALLVSKEMENR